MKKCLKKNHSISMVKLEIRLFGSTPKIEEIELIRFYFYDSYLFSIYIYRNK
jgi:hypothetical protein